MSIAVCISGTSSFGIRIVLSPVGLLDFFPGFFAVVATGTTGKLLRDIVYNEEEYDTSTGTSYLHVVAPFKDNVTCLLSGPLGGDAQIGAMIAEGKIDCLIFFCDNLIIQGHQNDIQGLSRLASLYNIAFATNRTTADMIMTSPLFNDNNYHRIIPSVIESYKNRIL